MIKLTPAQPTDKLKEMYGLNLFETLRPSILENRIDVYTGDGKYKLNPQQIDIASGYKQPIHVPIYDSISRIIKYIVAEGATVYRQFTDLQLVQDWYYDRKKNMVFSSIKELFVYAKEADKEPMAVLKLVFK